MLTARGARSSLHYGIEGCHDNHDLVLTSDTPWTRGRAPALARAIRIQIMVRFRFTDMHFQAIPPA